MQYLSEVFLCSYAGYLLHCNYEIWSYVVHCTVQIHCSPPHFMRYWKSVLPSCKFLWLNLFTSVCVWGNLMWVLFHLSIIDTIFLCIGLTYPMVGSGILKNMHPWIIIIIVLTKAKLKWRFRKLLIFRTPSLTNVLTYISSTQELYRIFTPLCHKGATSQLVKTCLNIDNNSLPLSLSISVLPAKHERHMLQVLFDKCN